MSLLEYVLGDRASTYLLASCVLVAALAIIAAIIDLPLRSLREAGIRQAPGEKQHEAIERFLPFLGFACLLITFLGGATQAYVASSPANLQSEAVALVTATNIAFVLAVLIFGLTAPLGRHWGLCLGAFGLGLAALFLSLAAVLQLDFDVAGDLIDQAQRAMFALVTGVILVAVASCLAAILGLLAQIARGTMQLADEHRRHRSLDRVGRRQEGARTMQALSHARRTSREYRRAPADALRTGQTDAPAEKPE